MGIQSRKLFMYAVDFYYHLFTSRMGEFSMAIYLDASSRVHPTSELAYGNSECGDIWYMSQQSKVTT